MFGAEFPRRGRRAVRRGYAGRGRGSSEGRVDFRNGNFAKNFIARRQRPASDAKSAGGGARVPRARGSRKTTEQGAGGRPRKEARRCVRGARRRCAPDPDPPGRPALSFFPARDRKASAADDVLRQRSIHRSPTRRSSLHLGMVFSTARRTPHDPYGVVPLHLGMVFSDVRRAHPPRLGCSSPSFGDGVLDADPPHPRLQGVVPLHLGMVFSSRRRALRSSAGVVPLHLGMVFSAVVAVLEFERGVVPLHLGMVFSWAFAPLA